MPDLAIRGDRERRLAGALLLLFGDWKTRLSGGIKFSQRSFARDLFDSLEPELAGTHLASAEQLLAEYKIREQRSQAIADAWAKRFGKKLSGEVTANIADELAGVGFDDPDIAQRLERSLGDNRAWNIGITETTRGISAGERSAVGTIQRTLGLTLLAIWITERDELVCPICKPLDGKSTAIWGRIYPGGPPAHPRCRCYLNYRPLRR